MPVPLPCRAIPLPAMDVSCFTRAMHFWRLLRAVLLLCRSSLLTMLPCRATSVPCRAWVTSMPGRALSCHAMLVLDMPCGASSLPCVPRAPCVPRLFPRRASSVPRLFCAGPLPAKSCVHLQSYAGVTGPSSSRSPCPALILHRCPCACVRRSVYRCALVQLLPLCRPN